MPFGGSKPVFQEIPFQDPFAIFSPFASQEGAIFLDSATAPSPLARYSFIGLRPSAILISKNSVNSFQGKTWVDNPFNALHTLLAERPALTLDGLPPWQGGVAGIFSYDLLHCLENIPRHGRDDFAFPDLAVGFYDAVVAFDHHQQKSWLIARTPDDLQKLASLLAQHPAAPHPLPSFQAPVQEDWEAMTYEPAIQQVIDYIFAGDIFQANLTRRFQATLPPPIHPFDLYTRLRTINPAPFSAYMAFGDMVIASASPERFLWLHNNEVVTRPIKGTRPRGATPQEDQALAEELRTHEKDCAENIMIVDLMRNDLSRVCLPHSVKTPELLVVESYATVHHLVSTITGTLKLGRTAVDLLKATFPGGSITGAPKVRAMEIIAELEPTARGPYCGSIGYIGYDGTMDTNIVIRTFAIKGQSVTFQTGGGIVADSLPEKEFRETELKAFALKQALEGGKT